MSIWALVLCASLLIPVQGAEVNWISTTDGYWDDATRWNPEQSPGEDDDAKHLTKASATTIRQAEFCKTFQGNGAAQNDRFLVVQAGDIWTIGDSQSNDGQLSGTSGNFIVKLQDGSSSDITTVDVNGPVSALSFIVDDSQEFSGNYMTLDVATDVSDSIITLGDYVTIALGGSAEDTTLLLGDNADVDTGTGAGAGNVTGPGDGTLSWTIGDKGDVDIAGMVKGVDFTLGTSQAGSSDRTTVTIGYVGAAGQEISDTWVFQGYTTAESGCFRCVNAGQGQGAHATWPPRLVTGSFSSL